MHEDSRIESHQADIMIRLFFLNCYNITADSITQADLCWSTSDITSYD